MNIEKLSRPGTAVSIGEYAAGLARIGVRTVPDTATSFWAASEVGALMRIPSFEMSPPAAADLRRTLWKERLAVTSYLLKPDSNHPANAWLYTCAEREYSLDKLAPAVRRNVRRGLSELRVEFLASDQLLARGAQAYCDTRRRVGLSDGTIEQFCQRFAARANCPGHFFLGAWKDDVLAAFLSITRVGDWAEIEGCFSMDSLLKLRPNDTLLFSALLHYLTEEAATIVSYGISSVQTESNADGLHAFKVKVGFKAEPVHRAFVIHPLLRPLANRVTLWGVNTTLRLRPGDRRLKKAGGALACVLGRGPRLTTGKADVEETSLL